MDQTGKREEYKQKGTGGQYYIEDEYEVREQMAPKRASWEESKKEWAHLRGQGWETTAKGNKGKMSQTNEQKRERDYLNWEKGEGRRGERRQEEISDKQRIVQLEDMMLKSLQRQEHLMNITYGAKLKKSQIKEGEDSQNRNEVGKGNWEGKEVGTDKRNISEEKETVKQGGGKPKPFRGKN